MKKIPYILLVIAICFLLILTCTHSIKHSSRDKLEDRGTYDVEYKISFECSTAGKIRGRVTDKSNGEPLYYSNIRIVGTEIGTVVDSSGHFILDDIAPRKYNIQARSMGYEYVTAESIRVKIGEITIINFKLALGIK